MAPGNPPTALRAEFYAMVSWHCYLHHVLHYYDITRPFSITPHTDNEMVMTYYASIQNNQHLTLPYVDDFDVYVKLSKFYGEICNRGITINPIRKYPNTNIRINMITTTSCIYTVKWTMPHKHFEKMATCHHMYLFPQTMCTFKIKMVPSRLKKNSF